MTPRDIGERTPSDRLRQRATFISTQSRRSAAVFLDKDGTLIEDVPYNVDPDRIVLTPGAGDAVRDLAELGYRVFVVSNQPGVAHGRFALAALDGVAERLREMLAEHDVDLEAIAFCPHAPDAQGRPTCDCRKPQPGMLARLAATHDIDLARSWMVGDILDDVEAGRRAGCRTVLVDNGNETRWELGPDRTPHYIARDLRAAARAIANATLHAQADEMRAPLGRDANNNGRQGASA